MPLLKKLLFALGTGVIANCLYWSLLWLSQNVITGLAPIVTAFFAMLIRSFFEGFDEHVDLGVAFLAGLFAWAYFFYPRVLRRPLSRGLGYLHFGMTVVGMVLYYLLLERMFDNFSAFVTWGPCSGFALLVLAAGQVVFLINLVYSCVWGKKSL